MWGIVAWGIVVMTAALMVVSVFLWVDNIHFELIQVAQPRIVIEAVESPISTNIVRRNQEVLVEYPDQVVLEVPFVVQAPFGKWANPLFQDGCEEAALLMVYHWLNHSELTELEMSDEILKLSEWQNEKYGLAFDRSIQDVADLLEDRYGVAGEVVKEVTKERIKLAVMNGGVVIVPIDGTLLNNPWYSPPGPERHMLVVRGYDDVSHEFITNDPGTKRGEEWRYDQEHFIDAIRNYSTGNHEPVEGALKVMLVVTRNDEF